MIELRGLRKAFGQSWAVDGVSLAVEQGALVALLGPSGCGKTTTLRLIAGLEQPDAGEILLDGALVAGPRCWVPPEARRVGLVFQDYALFPHLTVAANIAFPLSGRPRAEQGERVGRMLALVGLEGYGERYPHQLSGGQQQRVALARALAPAPAVVLLDEPFSNLDAALRSQMRSEVQRIIRAAGATALFVTHDQEEALCLADQVAVMAGGRIAQAGTPRGVYTRPASRAVAEFVGATNWLSGTAQGDQALCELGMLPLASPATGPVDLLLRPEQLLLELDPDGSARVVEAGFYGHTLLVRLALPDNSHLRARCAPWADLRPGMRVAVRVVGAAVAFPVEGFH
ncbi:MAG: ABC transporter ATP-binding protein [Roseiflexaceae bacterium]